MELVLKKLTEQIIGAAIDVHQELGPGLLESAYEECLCYELSARKLPFVRQHSLPLRYKNVAIDCSYRIDLVIQDLVVVEIKAVEELTNIHEAQLLSYLRLGSWPVGLIINFNVARLVDGVIRHVGAKVSLFSSLRDLRVSVVDKTAVTNPMTI
jgi:GxxExxY protein